MMPGTANECPASDRLSLSTLRRLLLSGRDPGVPPGELVAFLDRFRLSAGPAEQLALLDVFYAVQFRLPDLRASYTPQLQNFESFLKLMAPRIRLNAGIPEEPEEIGEVKRALDALCVEYASGIIGHLYSPVILRGTTMVLDVAACSLGRTHLNDESWGQLDSGPETALYAAFSILSRKAILADLGWRLGVIPLGEWRSNATDERRMAYLERFISGLYLETQFRGNPPWATLRTHSAASSCNV